MKDAEPRLMPLFVMQWKLAGLEWPPFVRAEDVEEDVDEGVDGVVEEVEEGALHIAQLVILVVQMGESNSDVVMCP